MNSQTIATADWHETLYRWLSAPLLLTVIGALLINYLIPEITAKSQRSKEALETKASIVRDMTQATTAAVGTSRLVAMDVIKKEEVEEERRNATQQAAFNEGLQSWELDSADIGSRLEAYFRKTSPTVSSEWRKYAETATDVYFLSSTGLPDREARIARVQDYLAAVGRPGISDPDWRQIRDGDAVDRTAKFRAA